MAYDSPSRLLTPAWKKLVPTVFKIIKVLRNVVLIDVVFLDLECIFFGHFISYPSLSKLKMYEIELNVIVRVAQANMIFLLITILTLFSIEQCRVLQKRRENRAFM